MNEKKWMIDFADSIKKIWGNVSPQALHEPSLTEKERVYVQQCLDSGYVSSVGQYVNDFERALENYTGTKHAIVVSNGTAALHLAYVVGGVRQNDEVIVPTVSFVATANSVVHAGAVPHFVDSEHDTFGICPIRLRQHLKDIGEKRVDGLYNRQTNRRIGAIVPMHVFGRPCRIQEIIEIGKEFHIPIIEDAAEGVGTFLEGKHVGTFGCLGTLSFNGNKIITTGGGGAILTNDDQLAYRLKQLSTTSKQPHPYRFFHDEVAWNYRMPNLNAALGLAQLERIETMISVKEKLGDCYERALSAFSQLNYHTELRNVRWNCWLHFIELASVDDTVSELMDVLVKERIGARPLWELLHTLPMYQQNPRSDDVSNAVHIHERVICLPSSATWGGILE